MKKKVFFTLAFAAILALGFVCQKQSSVNALVNNNIEALTYGDGGNVSLEPANTLTMGYTKVFLHNDPITHIPVYIDMWLPTREGYKQGPRIDGDMYMCTLGEGNKYDNICFEIYVRP